MTTLRQKVLAYLTHGDRLLVFSHPHAPEAGIQVPAGTLKDGERPEDGVLREANEETGLSRLRLARFLGESLRDMAEFGIDQIHHRRYYHVVCEEDPPERWRHLESDPSDGGPAPIVFEFFWARLPDEVPELAGAQGEMLPELMASRRLAGDGRDTK